MRRAFDLCLAGISPHPDYLLGADTIGNFRRRGLTVKQWSEWQIYFDHFPSPLSRADINTGLIRHSVLAPYTKVDAADLMPRYGRKRERKTDEEMLEICKAQCGIVPDDED